MSRSHAARFIGLITNSALEWPFISNKIKKKTFRYSYLAALKMQMTDNVDLRM